MRICFIAMEIFAWGKYGGFGRATRTIGRELVKRGVEVTAIIPRRGEQKPIEDLDGIRVYGFDKMNLFSAVKLYRLVDADIYHSQEPSFGTFLARALMPDRAHLVTFRDTRDSEDWLIERRLPTKSVFQVIKNQIYEDNFLVKYAIKKATRLFAASYLVQRKAIARYQLDTPPQFLPTPVELPVSVKKSEVPTICFVARWDRRKRPEIFFKLAEIFPQVKFIAVGKSYDKGWDDSLRSQYGALPNLELAGFVDQFDGDKLGEIYQKSWILVNTSAREGLPNSFIEALAHRCAILSSVDPDQFASRYGYFAKEDDFVHGVEFLLENNRWAELGQQGYKYVSENFEYDMSINRHMDIYQSVLVVNSLKLK